MGKSTGGGAVLLERDGGLAIIRFNRPESYNALNGALAEGLLASAVSCDEDASVRAVMITGTGTAFCAGGDIQAMRDNADADGSSAVFLKTLTVPLHGAIATLARMRKPVIGAVNGVAAGAGFSIALACDLVLAAAGASFTMAYTRIGAVPDGSSTYFLPRAVGFKRAYDLIAGNRVLSAADARDMGIVSEVYADGEFAEKALATAQRLAAGPTLALGRAKQLLTFSGAETLETQMEHERRAIAASGASADFKAGTTAFLEKRKPKFSGT